MLRALALVLILSAAPALGQVESRIADCRLTVAGQDHILGPCTFSPQDAEGSFQIAALGEGSFFAYVFVTGPDTGVGYWNGGIGGHAHFDLGVLTRIDTCWQNDAATVCAR